MQINDLDDAQWVKNGPSDKISKEYLGLCFTHQTIDIMRKTRLYLSLLIRYEYA